MLRRICIACLGYLVPLALYGQIDSTRTAALDALIEDVISGVEIDEQVDFTEWSDELQAMLQRPLDLNRALREELALLPGMDALRINQLKTHIDRFGPLTSVYELQAVDGFSLDVIRRILPFVKTDASRETDIRRENQHPAGPGLREIREGLTFEWLQRMVWIAEEQKGYTPPDSSFREIVDDQGNLLQRDTLLTTRYIGNPYRHYSRLRLRYGKHVSLALTAEKDPGEQFAWNPQEGLYGYDFLSGHVALRDFGRLKRLVIGDYTIETGQGMVLSRGLGFGKSAEAISTLKGQGRGIMPYASVNENQLMRGIAATYAVGSLYFTGFFSRIKLDASIQEADTLSQEILEAGGLQLSGLHRTPSERANRRALQETVVGGRIEYRKGTLKLGTTHYYQQFAAPLIRATNSFNQFDFRGDRNFLNGVDFDWAYRNFNVFGEAARSRSGGTAILTGVMASLTSNFDVSLLARRFDRDFHSLKAYVFAERPTAVRNEQGLYLGLRIIPRPRWTWQSYIDRYRYPWNTFRASGPLNGWEVLSQLSFRPRRGTEIYVRARSDNKARNLSELPVGQQVAVLAPTRKNQLRFHLQTKIDRDFSSRTRLEFAWFQHGEAAVQRGYLFYQDLSYKWGFKFRLTGRLAFFDAPSYDARIYAYENDVLGFFSIPAYYRTGTRAYGILNWKPIRGLEFWLRVAQTRLRNVCERDIPPFGGTGELVESCTFGSGLEEIRRPTRTEIKIQMRWMIR